MDIKITHSSLKKFLDTPADAITIAENLSLCGPTFDRIHAVGDDHVFEIEAITNRIDTASSQGIAREASTILTQFGIPSKMVNDPYKEEINLYHGLPTQFHFEITDNTLLRRFTAVALSHTQIKPSPKDTQTFLELCDQRPLNNAIDITNELTLLYGMPSHIFDLDKLAAQKLTIRDSKEGEIVDILDGSKCTLRGSDIVIEDGTGRLVDLCGVMGGSVAEVDEHTKNILLIVPAYHPQKIRRTSLYLQKRTLASQIYEKSPDPELCLPVLNQAIKLFQKRLGAEVSSPVYDFYPVSRPPKSITLDLEWLNHFVGQDIPKDQVITILSGLGFAGKPLNDSCLECVIPSWRYEDINIREDLAEEIARIFGYFRLPPILPATPTTPESPSLLLSSETKIKKFLADIGYHEVYNNSLISLDIITKSKQDPGNHLKLTNALSQDFEYLRLQLAPSLLQNLRNNQGKVDLPINIFEVANTYQPKDGEILPQEISHLCFISTQSYRHVKGHLESLLSHLSVVNADYVPGKSAPLPFAGAKTAEIKTESGSVLGYIGEIDSEITRAFDIKSEPVLVELDLTTLIKNITLNKQFQPISEFPDLIESITIETDEPLSQAIKRIRNTSQMITQVTYVGSYGNRHTFTLHFNSPERNLSQKEINDIKALLLG